MEPGRVIMSLAEQSPEELMEAKNRFMQLHFRAACVRVETLREMLQRMEPHGGLSANPQGGLEEAISAATDILESLEAAKQQFAPTERFPTAPSRPGWIGASDAPRKRPAPRRNLPLENP